MPDARTEAWAALSQKAIPTRALADLLRAFGGPEAILGATRARLAAIVPANVAERVATPLPDERVAAMRDWLADPEHALIAWDDPDYPRALLDVGDAPAALFFMGRKELLNRPAFSIVGSRQATAQGLDNAREFARALSAAGLTIVSGLALGIDAAAHEGALAAFDEEAGAVSALSVDGAGPAVRAGSTLAVVGTGLDRVYPARHRALAHALAERGGLVSEFAPGTPPIASNFPRRNRLIAGLARGVLVVEAALQSGSLVTARLAGDQGRDVFAIPGSIHSPLSKGCHKLIREGAKLVETAQDILDELSIDAVVSQDSRSRLPGTGESAGVRDRIHERLLLAMGHDPVDADTLAARTALGAAEIATALVTLELEGAVAALPGARWQRRK